MFPILSDLPFQMATHAVIGTVYGYIFNADPKMAACACMVRTLADTVLFAFANPFFGGDLGVRSMKVYLATHSFITFLSFFAFRKLQLIATKGTIVLGAVASLSIVMKYHTLKEMEVAAKIQP